jgi:hypothetical protein
MNLRLPTRSLRIHLLPSPAFLFPLFFLPDWLRQSGRKKEQWVRNDRLLGGLETRHNPPRYLSLGDVLPQLLAEIEHFFVSFKEMEGRTFTILGST